MSLAVQRKGFMFVLSSPSGAGKTTISRKLLKAETRLSLSVSATTRPPRANEVDGKDYFFISKEAFEAHIANGDFLEHAEVFGNYYGTLRHHVELLLNQGHDVLFDIDWQGTFQLTQLAREDVVSIFILPPSIEELERRLRSRGLDSDDVIQTRMNKAHHDIEHWYSYDYVTINHELDVCLADVTAVLRAERLKRSRQQGLHTHIESLLKG